MSCFLCQEEQFSTNGGVFLDLSTFSGTKGRRTENLKNVNGSAISKLLSGSTVYRFVILVFAEYMERTKALQNEDRLVACSTR